MRKNSRGIRGLLHTPKARIADQSETRAQLASFWTTGPASVLVRRWIYRGEPVRTAGPNHCEAAGRSEDIRPLGRCPASRPGIGLSDSPARRVAKASFPVSPCPAGNAENVFRLRFLPLLCNRSIVACRARVNSTKGLVPRRTEVAPLCGIGRGTLEGVREFFRGKF